jgi:hypothetical protein
MFISVLLFLEAVSKLHLASNGCVAIRFEMLKYLRVRAAFKSNRRLALERNLKL